MKTCILVAFLFAAVPLYAQDFIRDDDFSITPGGGSFFALRHNKPAGKPYIEIIGSPLAMDRAINQAEKGGYKLEVAGPFAWHTSAATFIRKKWDPRFGGGGRKRKNW